MTPDELRAFRDQHDLTRVQVAALLSVAPGTVRNWEQGVRGMPFHTDIVLRQATRAQIEQAKRRYPPKRRARRALAAPGGEG